MPATSLELSLVVYQRDRVSAGDAVLEGKIAMATRPGIEPVTSGTVIYVPTAATPLLDFYVFMEKKNKTIYVVKNENILNLLHDMSFVYTRVTTYRGVVLPTFLHEWHF